MQLLIRTKKNTWHIGWDGVRKVPTFNWEIALTEFEVLADWHMGNAKYQAKMHPFGGKNDPELLVAFERSGWRAVDDMSLPMPTEEDRGITVVDQEGALHKK